jgi:hypothetical protein
VALERLDVVLGLAAAAVEVLVEPLQGDSIHRMCESRRMV